MTYVWFNLILEALGKRLNYESISNIYGNSFAKDAAKIVQAANPLLKNGAASSSSIADLAGHVSVVSAKTKEEGEALAIEKLGDIGWAEGMFN